MPFTPEELEEMRRADEEIEREFSDPHLAAQYVKELDKELDRIATYQNLDNKQVRIRERKAAYYQSHREEECQRVRNWYTENRDRKIAQVAEWKRKKRAALTSAKAKTA